MSENRIDLPHIERHIGEHLYRCSNLLLSKWLELETLVLKLLGTQVLDIDENNLDKYVGRIVLKSTRDDHEKLFELLGECLIVQMPEGNWSALSRQNQERWWAVYRSEMPAVIGMFFEVQFKDFFTGLERLFPEAKK